MQPAGVISNAAVAAAAAVVRHFDEKTPEMSITIIIVLTEIFVRHLQ